MDQRELEKFISPQTKLSLPGLSGQSTLLSTPDFQRVVGCLSGQSTLLSTSLTAMDRMKEE